MPLEKTVPLELTLEFSKLEKALQLANLPNFKALPEFPADDPACQNFVRNLLQQAVVSDLLGGTDSL